MSKHLLCTWCKGVLNSNDTIYSTSCGHVFHFVCMRKCQSLSKSCPQCSYVSPPTHELFLFFEKCGDEDLSTNWNDKLKIIQLHKEIEDNKNVLLHLQEKYSVSQDLVRKLEEKNRICNNGISQRTSIISDLEDRIKVLEELNQFLTIDSECKSNSLREITELKDSLEKGGTESNVCKQAGKLKKDKTELQKYINLSTSDAGINGTAKNETTASNSIRNINKKVPYQNEPEKHFLSEEVTEDYSVTSISEMFNLQGNSNSSTDSSILIKHFPIQELQYPLHKIILTFVVSNQGCISEHDITKVYVTDINGESYSQHRKEVTLFVQFKNRYLKNKFLLNRAAIQQASPSLEFIEMNKFTDGIKKTVRSYSDGRTMIPNSGENINKKVLHQNEPDKQILPQEVTEDYSVTFLSEMFNTQDNSNSSTDNSILIKNFPKHDLIYPLQNLILTFVVSKQGHISEDDITEVYVKDGNGKSRFELPKEVTLFVRFKNRDLKNKFLLNLAHIHQASPPLEIVEIGKYNDGIKATAKSYSDGTTMIPNSRENINRKVAYNGSSLKDQNVPEQLLIAKDETDHSVTSISEFTTDSGGLIGADSKDDLNSSTDRSLYIKNFPKNKLIYPLQKLILTFVVIKQGHISKADITKVYVKDAYGISYSKLPEEVTLFVQFKDRELKNKFLLNRAAIQQASPSLEFIEIDKYNDGIKATAKYYSTAITKTLNSSENINTKVSYHNEPNKYVLPHEVTADYSVSSISEDNSNSSTANSILIENVPKNDLIYPLKKVILRFVATKQGDVSEEDITEVYVKGGKGKRHHQHPKIVTLFVQFKTRDLKNKFLLNQAAIQQASPSLKFIEIDNCNDVIKGSTKSYSDVKTMIPNSKENINTNVACTPSTLKNQSVTSIPEYSMGSGSLTDASSIDTALYIKNFPKNELINCPLKEIILTFVTTKEGDVSEDDITELYVKDGKDKDFSQLPQKVTLFVRFKNRDLKNKLLLNRASIQQALPSLEFIEIDKYNDGIKATAKYYSTAITKTLNSSENINTKVSYHNEPNKYVLPHEVTEDYSVSSISEDNSNSSTANNSILIENVPKNDLIYPLKQVILRFVATKQGDVSEEDITEVYVKGGKGKRHHQHPKIVTLFVQFKTRDLKNKFLLNQAAIQQASPSLKFIEIDNCNDVIKGSTKSYSDVKTMIPNSKGNINTNVACTPSTLKNQSVTSIPEYSMGSGSLTDASSIDTALYIKNFPKNELINCPLKEIILTFVTTKEGDVSEDDITELYVKDGKDKDFAQLPQKVTLFVRFKNRDLKNKLLLNRASIQQALPSLEFIEIDKYNDGIKATAENYSSAITKTLNSSENINTKVSYHNEPEKYVLPHMVTEDYSVSSISEDNSNSSTANNSILIKNVPKNDLIYPLKQVILRFVATKQGDVSEEDITEVYVKGGKGKRRHQLPKIVTLFVQFKTRDLKNKFLLNQAAIQQASPSLEFIEIDNCNDVIKGSTKSNSDDKTMIPNSKGNINTKVACTPSTLKNQTVTSIPECSMGSGSLTDASSIDNALYIKNFPKNELINCPLKEIILTFVTTKEGDVSEDDITEVYVKDCKDKDFSQLPQKVTLFVQFKNRDLKNKFLLNQDAVQQASPSLEFIEIDKFNEDINEDLLKYATQKLRGRGFNYFFRNKDEVMALKNRSDAEGIRIRSKSHVNKLLKSLKKN